MTEGGMCENTKVTKEEDDSEKKKHDKLWHSTYQVSSHNASTQEEGDSTTFEPVSFPIELYV